MGFTTHEQRIKGSADEPAETWRKSSRSYANGGCVEVAPLPGKLIGVRDSKNVSGTRLWFRHAEWDAFVGAIRNGEFDRHC